MMWKYTLGTALLMLLCLGSGAFLPAAEAAGRVSPDTLKQWHDACLAGDAKQIDAQIKKFERYLEENPKDYLAQVYLGGACALRSQASFWGPTKLKYLKRAESLMDEAVAAAPGNARVRMVNAIGSYRIPVRFKRRQIAVRDFKILVPIARSNSRRLSLREKQAVLYYASLTYAEEGIKGVADLRKQCYRLDPDSEYGKLTK